MPSVSMQRLAAQDISSQFVFPGRHLGLTQTFSTRRPLAAARTLASIIEPTGSCPPSDWSPEAELYVQKLEFFQVLEHSGLHGCRPALDSALSVVQGSQARAETVLAS